MLKGALLDFAQARDPALAEWIEGHAAFPNSMVDRITPVPQPAQIADFRARYGLDDEAPIFTETFRQWVIEDHFLQDRPAWEAVGVQFVADVAPFELMKLRLLNCSHLAIAGLGQLAGYRLVSETMSDPYIEAYMRALMDRETGPTLAPVPGIDLDEYKRTLVRRFANTAIEDTVQRVNTDAPLTVILDPLRDRLRDGRDIPLLALALAAWLRRVRGEDEEGRPIIVSHPLAPLLRQKAEEGGPDPGPLLGIERLFGNIGSDPRLRQEVGAWLSSLYENGVRETLRRVAEREHLLSPA
jgi:mannitol-1-phosphate/altronate dehydrogenase